MVPNDKRAISHCIYIYLLKEDYNLVITESKTYLESYPDDISIMFHQAKAYNKLNEKHKAIDVYKQIIMISLDKSVKAKALYESATNRSYNEEFEDIVKELEESYDLDPKEGADEYLAALYTDKKMYEKAEEWLIICGKRVNITNDKTYMEIKAQIELYKKHFDEAINCYLKLADMDIGNSMEYNLKIEIILQIQANQASNN